MSFLLPANDEVIARRRRWTIAVVISAVFLLGFGWKPAHDVFRRAHARKLVAEAEAYMAQNRLSQALELVTRAARKAEPDAKALRLLLELNARAGKPEAYTAWAKLARLPEIGVRERQELLRWAVAWRQVEAADAQWRELERERPLAPENIRLGAAYFEMRGDAARAVLFARESLARKPDDLETRVLLGRVLLTDGGASDQAIGKRLLLEQAGRKDKLGLAVLRHLAGSQALLPFEASECLRQLEIHPAREKPDELTAAELRMQLMPYRRSELLASAAREFVQSGGELLAAARWLLSHQAYDQVIAIVPPNSGRESSALAMCRMDALGELGRWGEIEQALAAAPEVLEGFERALYRARAATELKQGRLADLQWKQAQEHAGKEPRKLIRLAAYAKTARAWDAAEQALRSLSEQAKFKRTAYQSLVQLFEAKQDGAQVRAVLLEMKAKFPDEPAIQNDLAYLNLLQKKEINSSRAAADRLLSAHPDHLAFRATAALGHLRTGAAERARELLEEESVDWTRALPGHRAVYGAVLGQCGHEERARSFCREIPIEVLKPEEKELIAKWL